MQCLLAQILRKSSRQNFAKKGNKEIILYEVVTRNTTEEFISQKRSDVRQFQDVKQRFKRGLFE